MATIDLALLHLAKVEKKANAPHLVFYDDLFQYRNQGVPSLHPPIPIHARGYGTPAGG